MDNPQIELARKIIETTDTSLFLTGKAGTGKTTFLRRLRSESPKRMVVLAPTGIAAINAGGTTIHSFFQLSFAPFVPGATYTEKQRTYGMNKQKIKLLRTLDLLVIDEISMVRADLLDAVDDTLKRYRHSSLPFGGVQLLLIGDLQQLAPVVKDEEWDMLKQFYATPYFFSSLALQKTNYATVELETVYRQSNPEFLSLLNHIRIGNVSQQVLDKLNSRYIPGFRPENKDGYIQLVTHNYQAHNINSHEMEMLDAQPYTYDATIKGNFPEYAYPTDLNLTLKCGAQVMFVKNDTDKRYFNGMIGEVVKISNDGFTVSPKSDPEQLIEVHKDVWENTRYVLDEKTKEIKEKVDGTFEQYPVKLAWAITIHKSQGLTFNHVMIDASSAFAHGQTYVALSRCRTLEGIVLTSRISQSAIIADKHIDAYNNEMAKRRVDNDKLTLMRHNYSLHLVAELFNFEKERIGLASMTRIFQEFLSSTYASTTRVYEDMLRNFDMQVMNVSGTFHQQYTQMLHSLNGDVENEALQVRIRKGAEYFADKLYDVRELIENTQIDIDNAATKKRITTTSSDLLLQVRLHIKLLEIAADEGFTTSSYLQNRAKILLQIEESSNTKSSTNQKNATTKSTDKESIPTEIKNGDLYYRLKAWRAQRATADGVPAYMVLNTKALIAMANYVPTETKYLIRMPHFGNKSMEKYGAELLELIKAYAQEHNLKPAMPDSVLQQPAEQQPETPKEPKEKTYEKTLRLYLEGKKPQAIADERELALSTIISHLARYISSGEVHFDDLVSPANFERTKAYFATHPYSQEQRLTDIRNSMGDDISFNDIKLSMLKLGYIKDYN